SSKGNFPSDSNIFFKYFRIIYSTESFDKSVLNPRDAIDADQVKNIKILEGESNTVPDLEDNTVDNLSNNQLYFFRGMLVDEANNIMDITDDNVYLNNSSCGSDMSAPVSDFDCPLTATPDQVIGILAEDLNCFISTVAFGSNMAQQVRDFRLFRKKILLSTTWGRWVNRVYYKYGSVLAQYIANSEVAKSLSRMTLYPLWWFAKVSLKLGFFVALILALLGGFAVMSLLLFMSYRWRKTLVQVCLLSFLISNFTISKVQAQEVVEPKMRNSLPSSQYDNPTNREVRMPHPNAKKGLTRITSDKEYIYDVYESPNNHSMAVKFGMYEPSELTGDTGVEFSSIYDNPESPMLLIDYEWKWKNILGEVNWQVGTGLYLTQGHGVFKNDSANPARERFTFFAIPLTGSLIYKMMFSDHQWLIPYGGGGIGIIGFSELRDDNAGPKFGGAVIAPVFAGGALSINAIAPHTARTMDREYGINKTLIAVEFRQLLGVTTKYDFTGSIINAGLMIEY
ncbi:MAG: hypothetical protein KDD40_00385, partial [Bdellovibrionales bacterium]|nr:hypothetical protein [Bdellovibrionales bacterium]